MLRFKKALTSAENGTTGFTVMIISLLCFLNCYRNYHAEKFKINATIITGIN